MINQPDAIDEFVSGIETDLELLSFLENPLSSRVGKISWFAMKGLIDNDTKRRLFDLFYEYQNGLKTEDELRTAGFFTDPEGYMASGSVL